MTPHSESADSSYRSDHLIHPSTDMFPSQLTEFVFEVTERSRFSQDVWPPLQFVKYFNWASERGRSHEIRRIEVCIPSLQWDDVLASLTKRDKLFFKAKRYFPDSRLILWFRKWHRIVSVWGDRQENFMLFISTMGTVLMETDRVQVAFRTRFPDLSIGSERMAFRSHYPYLKCSVACVPSPFPLSFS